MPCFSSVDELKEELEGGDVSAMCLLYTYAGVVSLVCLVSAI